MSENNINHKKIWKNAFGDVDEAYDTFGYLMIFRNYGKQGSRGAWNIEHIYPINPHINNLNQKCKYSGSDEQENLQPMSVEANSLKKDALTGVMQILNRKIRWQVRKSLFRFGKDKKRIGLLGIYFENNLCLYIYNGYAYQYDKKNKKMFYVKFNKDFYNRKDLKEFFDNNKKELKRSSKKDRFFDPINPTEKNKKDE